MHFFLLCLFSFANIASVQANLEKDRDFLVSQVSENICGTPNPINLQYEQNFISNVQPVGIVKVCGNYAQGFKLFINSNNGGELREQGDGRYKFIYRVNATTAGTVGGGDGIDIVGRGNGGIIEPVFQPGTNPTLLYTSPNGANCNRGQNNGCDVGVQWQITSTDPMPEGRYSDTIRFSVVAN